MLMKMFSLKDHKISSFDAPHAEVHVHNCIRGLQAALAAGPSNLSKYPEDFTLYYVGMFDSDTGMITPTNTPEHVVDVSALVPKPLKFDRNTNQEDS